MNEPRQRDRSAARAAIQPWLDPRRRRFWLLIAALLYTLVGFFVVPWITRVQIVEQLSGELNLPVRLEDLRFNPWTITAEANQFAIEEPDGTPIVGFERLVVNLQVSSLFRWALTFAEVRLEKPFGNVTRQPDGALNIDPVVSAALGEATPKASTDDSLPRLLISQLVITDGIIDTRDESLATPFDASVGPIDIAVEDLSTLPERVGLHQVSLSTARGTRLEWTGTVELEPLISDGRVTATGPYLPMLYQYFQDEVNFEVTEGAVELGFDYRLELDPIDGLSFEVVNAESTLRGTTVRIDEDPDNPQRFVTLPEVRLRGGGLAWPARTVAIDSFEIDGATVSLRRNADGELNVERLLVAQPVPEPEAAVSDADSAPWDMRLDSFRIEDTTVEFSDLELSDDVLAEVHDLRFSVANLTNEANATWPFNLVLTLSGGGDVTLSGDAGALPEPSVTAELSVIGLALPIAQPWISDALPLDIDGGTLDTTASLKLDRDETFSTSASLTINDLDITDRLLDERLFGWQRAHVDRIAFSTAQQSLDVSRVLLDSPFARVHISENQTTNFQWLSGTAQDPTSSDDAPAPAVTIGEIAVENGTVDFSDLSLPLPFAARIGDFEGNVRTLSTQSSEPAQIKLAGTVGEYGLAEVTGRVRASDPNQLTDIDVRFRNIEMPELSPYTIRFAGRVIDKGRIDLELGYRIQESRLQGENSIVIRELELGEKVDHPDAFDLPLGLAVSLLKDPEGTIDLDLPVSGQVDDPEFSIGGVVVQALANLITKIVTSPFRLLGNLVGIESDDFGVIEFRPGESELTPPEEEKIAHLAEALTLRPTLGILISGVSAPEADTAALKIARVETAIDTRLGEIEAGTPGTDGTTRVEARREAVEGLVSTAAPATDLAAFKAENQRLVNPAEPDGEHALDVPAYIAALEKLLIEAEQIGNADLVELAVARATAVREALSDEAGMPIEGISMGEVRSINTNESNWVQMELEVRSRG